MTADSWGSPEGLTNACQGLERSGLQKLFSLDAPDSDPAWLFNFVLGGFHERFHRTARFPMSADQQRLVYDIDLEDFEVPAEE